MAVTLPIGFNFRDTSGFVTDVSPDVYIKAQPTSTTYSSGLGYGFTSPTTNGNGQDRSTSIGAKLAGIWFRGGGADNSTSVFRVDTGNGTFNIRLAIGDATSSHTNYKVELFDGASTTAILSLTGTSVPSAQWYDATNTLRTSATNWNSNNAVQSISIANDYLRVRIGTGTGGPGDYTCVSHLAIESGVTYTYSRPASDITTQWTASTPGAAHYTMINEAVYNDTNYIYSTASSQTDEVKLQTMSTPLAGSSVSINYRIQGVASGAAVTVSLYCGAVPIKTDITRNADSSTFYTMTVLPTEWAFVTDWTNMRIRFVSS